MKKTFSFAAVGLLLLFGSLAGVALSQDYIYAVGNPNFSVNIPIEHGYINVTNGNLHLEIPLSNVPQRGDLQHSSRLVYDSRIWEILNNGTSSSWQPLNVPAPNTPTYNSMAGWRYVDGNEVGSVDWVANTTTTECSESSPTVIEQIGQFTYTDPSGTVHPFDIAQNLQLSSCSSSYTNTSANNGSYANDASGYYMSVITTNGSPTVTVADNNGNQVYPQQIDRNGNYTSYDANGNPINTLGNTPVIITNSGNQTTYSVLIAGGGRANYIVTTETISYQTLFNQAHVSDTSGSMNAIKSIQFPDGSTYAFTYDPSYGELTSMTLPSRGEISYQYSNFVDSYGNTNSWVSQWQNANGTSYFSPAVITPCSSSTATGCTQKMTVTTADKNDIVYTSLLNNGAWNTQAEFWEGSSTSSGIKLLTENTNYNFSNPCPTTGSTPACNGSEFITITANTMTLSDAPGGPITSMNGYTIDPNSGKLKNLLEWDYYTGTQSSTPNRETDYTYGYFVNNASLPTQMVQQFNGSPFSQISYYYDQSSLIASGATQHLALSRSRGNLTSIVQGLSGNQTTKLFTYDDAGMLRSTTDPRSNTTTYSYTCNDAYLARTIYPTTNGIAHSTSVNPDCSSGSPLSTTDQNNQTTNYSYDSYGRLNVVNYPGGGQIGYSYPLPTQVVETKAISANVSATYTITWDAYGRKNSMTQSDPAGNDTVSYSYASNPRKTCTTNPERSAPSSTDGTTCYTFDVLSRIVSVALPDGNQIGVVYLGNQATVTDENGHQKQYTYDSFHDLIKVLEPNASGALSWETDYAYDASGHVISVNQVGDGSGTRVRTFAYDSLGRMTQQVTPESGTTTYGYDGNGNLSSKTDNRGITTAYAYDPLNRLTSKTYTNDPAGTVSSCYQYDQSSVPGASSGAAGNMLGRMSNEWTQAGACPAAPAGGVLTRRSVLSYDPMGRVLNEQQCTPANCTSGAPFVPTYSYDLAGDILSSSNGTGMVSFSNTYDAAGHLSTLTSSWDDATHPPTLFSAPSYTPAGALTSATFGAGLNLSRTYDSRQRITNETDTGAAVQ